MAIKNLIIFGLLDVAVIVTIILFLPGLPPYVEFEEYTVPPAMKLEGPLAPNTLLNGAERLFEGKIKGPEAFAFRKDEVYFGLGNGDIVMLKKDKMKTIARIGKPCAGEWEPEICGRPLGLRFGPDGMLYVADAFYGIYKVDVDRGTIIPLNPIGVPINGKEAKIPNSVAIAKDGTVYWTDSSTDFALNDGAFTVMAPPSGRLMKYNPRTNTSEQLLDNLHFANGIQLSSSEDYLIVAETVKFRINKYNLKGPNKGKVEIFLEGLPGNPDNISPNGKGGFYISLISSRLPGELNPVDLLAPHPWIRKLLLRTALIVRFPFEVIDKVLPNEFVQKIIHKIGHFETITPLQPKYTVVLDVDENGKIVDSLHCTNNAVAFISEAGRTGNTLYLGSPFNEYLGKVELPEEYILKEAKSDDGGRGQSEKEAKKARMKDDPPKKEAPPPKKEEKEKKSGNKKIEK